MKGAMSNQSAEENDTPKTKIAHDNEKPQTKKNQGRERLEAKNIFEKNRT